MTDPLAPMAPSRPPPSRQGSGRTALMILSAPGAGGATLARVLQAAGAVPPADPAAVAALNDRALADVGSARDDPFGPRRRGEPPPPAPDLVAQGRALLRTPEPHDPLLVLADPAQTRLAPLWTQALEAEGWRVALVLLVRPPAEAAAALAVEEGVARNRGLLLWGSTMLEGERASRGGRRVAVSYERLLSDPEAELDRIERGLALRLPRRTWDSAAEIEALLREAHRPPAAAALPAALAPLAAFADHLAAAAADEPGNADVPAETERWFDGLSELAAPVARRASIPEPDSPSPSPAQPDPEAARAAEQASARADAAEAQVAILQGALAVSRRRAAEAEALLQARATEASAGERDARSALASALASREASEAALRTAEAAREAAERRLDVRAGELAAQIAELDGRLVEADARADAVVVALQAVEAARRAQAAELDDERERHADARERLALTGISNHAAQARVRELEARLQEMERRRRWLSRLLGRG